jgi:ABC-type branched-subunit amino acid transport system ATPase component
MNERLIDDYINEVTKDMGARQRSDVDRELRTHILDSADALAAERRTSVDDVIIREVLAKMGPARQVAAMYPTPKTFLEMKEIKDMWKAMQALMGIAIFFVLVGLVLLVLAPGTLEISGVLVAFQVVFALGIAAFVIGVILLCMYTYETRLKSTYEDRLKRLEKSLNDAASPLKVCMAIFGMTPVKSGKMFLNGKPLHVKNTQQAVHNGIGLVSEDRKRYGLNFVWDIKNNIAISNLDAISKPLVSTKGIVSRGKKYFDELRIKATGINTKVITLSGGNQQKVVIARTLNYEPRLIILDEPTKGIDVGSKNEIYGLINDMAAKGVAVIMISSELPEQMAMSDRFIVMAEGRVVGELGKEDATDAAIMQMAVSTFKPVSG